MIIHLKFTAKNTFAKQAAENSPTNLAANDSMDSLFVHLPTAGLWPVNQETHTHQETKEIKPNLYQFQFSSPPMFLGFNEDVTHHKFQFLKHINITTCWSLNYIGKVFFSFEHMCYKSQIKVSSIQHEIFFLFKIHTKNHF